MLEIECCFALGRMEMRRFLRWWMIAAVGFGLVLGCEDPEQGTQNQFEDDVGVNDNDNDNQQQQPDACCIPDTDEGCPEGRVECGNVCCEEGEVCEDGSCQVPCPGEWCGDAGDICCDVDELCFGGGCVTPGDDCQRTEDCSVDEICEPSVEQCLPRDQIPVCEYVPDTDEFEPDVGCTWVSDDLDERPDRGDIVATPLVANLTDDNDDGLTNTDDIPNIVFPSFDRNTQGCCNEPTTVRILHGDCGDDGTFETLASISEPAIDNSSGMAIGDLTNDGVPELVGVTNINGRPEGTVAFRRVADDGTEWEVLWHNEGYPIWNVHTRGGAVASIADLDGDGNPEVIVGNVVLNGQTGELKWDGLEINDAEVGEIGVGNNAFLGPSGTVADITLDGNLEVIAGNTVYDYEGNELWTFDYPHASSGCTQGQLPCDGYTAVANFDDDPHPHVVIVRRGDVWILDHEGELVWTVELPREDCTRDGQPANESGPPTIADFNGDGHIEIGTAGADYYNIAKMECDVDDWEEEGCAERGILWKSPIDDCSSRATASSVFDFHGDDRAEVVYADEEAFRIYDGTTGEIVFEDDRHESNTRIEMPVIADVNNDGSAGVLVASAYRNRGDRPGLWLWEDPDGEWVRTRRIWNQHAYHITNVEEDGTIPENQERNWENDRLNNFRQNVEPAGLFDAPDLVVQDLEAPNVPGICAADGELVTTFTVGNEGALSVPEGVAVDVELSTTSEVVEHQRVYTDERLLPGNYEDFELTWELDTSLYGIELIVTAEVDPDGDYNECDETNNDALLDDIVCEVQG